MVNVPINFRLTGADDSEAEIDRLNKTVAKTRLEIDRFAGSKGLGALAAGRIEIGAAAGKLEVLAIEARRAEQRIGELNRELNDVNKTRPLQDVADDLVRAEAQAAELRAELKRLPVEMKRTVVANSVDFLGDLGTGFSALGGATAGIGGSVLGRIGGMGLQTGVGPLAQVGGGFQLAGDLFDVAEALPRMSSALSIAKTTVLEYIVTAGAEAAANTTLAGSAAATVAPLGSTASGLAALTVSLAPIALASVAAGAALFAMKSAIDDANESAKDLVNASGERIRIAEFERDTLSRLSLEETQQKIAIAQDDIKRREAEKEKLIADFAANEAGKGVVDTTFDLAFGLDNINDKLQTYNKELLEQQNNLNLLNQVLADKQLSDQLLSAGASIDAQVKKQIENQQLLATASSESLLEQVATNNLEIDVRQRNIEAGKALLATLEPSSEAYRTLSTILGDNTDRVVALQSQNQQLNESTIALVIGRERETALMEKQKTLLDSLADNRQRANELDKQRADLLAEQAAKEARQAEEGALRASQSERLALKNQELANAQESQKAREQAAKLASIRQQGTDKEADILAKLQASEGQALNKLNTSIGKINTDFMRSELKAVQAFRTEELDRTEDYNRERLKLVTDLSASLLEAATDNDVNAFISAQRAGLASLGELDTNFGVTGARSSRDFGMARNEAAQNREQQVADLQATYQAEQMERRRAAQVQLDETRAATEAQLAQTRESGKAVVTEVQRIQEEIQALQLQFQRETGELAARYEREAGQKRLNALQQSSLQLAGEYARLNQQLVANSTAIANNVGASFVNGVADTMQRLIGQVFGQQQGVTVNVGNVQMGSIATPEYVNGQLGALSQAVMGGLTTAFQGSR